MKIFFLLTLTLTIAACEQKATTDDEMSETTLQMYQKLCDGRDSCLRQLNQIHQECRHHLDANVVDQEMPFNQPHMQCFAFGLLKMDDQFKQRADQVFPVFESDVTITRGPAFPIIDGTSDPNALLVHLNIDHILVLGQKTTVNGLASLLADQQLSQKHPTVVLVVDKDAYTTDMMQAKRILSDAGFKNKSIQMK